MIENARSLHELSWRVNYHDGDVARALRDLKKDAQNQVREAARLILDAEEMD